MEHKNLTVLMSAREVLDMIDISFDDERDDCYGWRVSRMIWGAEKILIALDRIFPDATRHLKLPVFEYSLDNSLDDIIDYSKGYVDEMRDYLCLVCEMLSDVDESEITDKELNDFLATNQSS